MDHQVNGTSRECTVNPCSKMDDIIDIIDDDIRQINTFINHMDNLSKDIHRLTAHENLSPDDLPDDYMNMPLTHYTQMMDDFELNKK